MGEAAIPPRNEDRDPDDRVSEIREELVEFHTDVAMERENYGLRAGRIVASVEWSVYLEVAALLRGHGLNTLANHYEVKADRAETQSSLKGHD